jgi:hypothetical protein
MGHVMRALLGRIKSKSRNWKSNIVGRMTMVAELCQMVNEGGCSLLDTARPALIAAAFLCHRIVPPTLFDYRRGLCFGKNVQTLEKQDELCEMSVPTPR